MTSEQRLDRLERVVKLMVKAGLRARSQSREQTENINILIKSHMDTEEHVKRLTGSQEALAASQEVLAASQARTDRALRAFINGLRKGKNGESSN